MQELLNKILALVPDAQMSIRIEKPSKEEQEGMHETVHQRDGLFVIWNSTNESACPTQRQ